MVPFFFIATTFLSLVLFYYGTGKDKRVLVLSIIWMLIIGLIADSGYFENTLAKPPRFLFAIIAAIALSVCIYKVVKENKLNTNYLVAVHILRIPFDTKTVADLIGRINLLQANSPAQWGKMDAYQMLKHCTLSEEMFQGKKSYKRLFIGRLFGGMALNSILKNEKPMKKNQPTHPEMKITGTGSFENEKAKWIDWSQNASLSYAL
jgi:multisubunit Na+/H+ antiporter MnhF subunit